MHNTGPARLGTADMAWTSTTFLDRWRARVLLGLSEFQDSCEEAYPVLNFSDGEFIIKDIFYVNHSILLVNALEYQDSHSALPRNISLERTPLNLSSTNADSSSTIIAPHSRQFLHIQCTMLATPPTVLLLFFLPDEALQEMSYYSGVSSCDSALRVPVYVNADFTSLMTMNYGEIMKKGFLLNRTAINAASAREMRDSVDSRTLVLFAFAKMVLILIPAMMVNVWGIKFSAFAS